MEPEWHENNPIEFHFDPMDTTEELEQYRAGGYHPVAIGDMLDAQRGLAPPQRRYRVLHKLGFGSYATVWLARDVRSGVFVALKITTADVGAHDAREAHMLVRVVVARVLGTRAPGHVLDIFEHFTLDGPNGTHHVLVTEVVVPVLAILETPRPPAWRKALAHGLVRGVAQMHACGVKHGGNLGCAFPELGRQAESDVVQDLSPYDVTVVLPCNPAAQTPSLPPYVVSPCALAQYWRQLGGPDRPPHLKLLDFGNARRTEDAAGDLQCVPEYCAPEVAFARTALDQSKPAWGTECDVWAVGVTIYELMAGSSLFNPRHGISGKLLLDMVVLAGGVPSSWEPFWSSDKHLQDVSFCRLLDGPPHRGFEAEISREHADAKWREKRERVRGGCEDDAEADGLVRLLRRMLVLDPEKRPTIQDVLRDPWFDGR